jgi:hypothetical protein
MEWWAVGDFDGDGFDSILVYRSIGPDGGTLADIDAFLLTRRNPIACSRGLRNCDLDQ